MITYEEQLDRDAGWALLEGSKHFEKESAVHKTLHRVASRLEKLDIPYALAGAMAMFLHGYRRFSEDIDMVVTREGLAEIHRQLEGLDYVPLFKGSRHLRDADSGVRIVFLVTGEYPGDGKPKPVSFPDPKTVATRIEGLCVLPMTNLVELKLASGTTNPARMKDLADVQEMIAVLDLPAEFADPLDPFVQSKYRELWALVNEDEEQVER